VVQTPLNGSAFLFKFDKPRYRARLERVRAQCKRLVVQYPDPFRLPGALEYPGGCRTPSDSRAGTRQLNSCDREAAATDDAD
jgi:hypothetical protein